MFIRRSAAALAGIALLAGCGGPSLEIAEVVPCPIKLISLDVPVRPVLELDENRQADSAAYQVYYLAAERHMDSRDRQDAARDAQIAGCAELSRKAAE